MKYLGRIIAFGDDGTDLESPAAEIRFVVDDTPATGEMGGSIEFYTTADASETLTAAMTIAANQNLLIHDGNGLIVGHIVGITAGALSELQVLGTSLTDSSIVLGAFSADAVGPDFQFVKSRNASLEGNTIVNDNDELGRIVWLPADGADFATEAAVFQAEVDDASPAAGDIGLAFVWESMAGGGASIAERMRLSAAGDLSIANGGGLIIGNATQITGNALAELQVLGTGLADSSILLGAFSADAVGPEITFVKSRNAAIGSFTVVNDNDEVGKIVWLPDDGTDYATEAAVFSAEVDDGSPATGDIGMAFVWQSMAGGAASLAERMRLSAAGDLSIANDGGVIIGSASQITANAASEFQVLGTALADSSMILGAFSADAVGPELQFVKSRHATLGSNTIVNDNDEVGKLVWLPADGADFATEAAVMVAEVDDGSPAAGDVGMAFVWKQMPGGGGGLAETMRVTAAGVLTLAGSADLGSSCEANAYTVGGVAGVDFNGAVTNLTVAKGIVTAAS